MTLCSAQAWEINSRQDLKASIHRRLVLLLDSWKPLHIRLSKAQEDVKVRILRKRGQIQKEQSNQYE
jgi:hypothetical protein